MSFIVRYDPDDPNDPYNNPPTPEEALLIFRAHMQGSLPQREPGEDDESYYARCGCEIDELNELMDIIYDNKILPRH